MNRNIIKSDLIPKERLKVLQKRSNAAGLARFIPQTLLYLVSAAAMVWAGPAELAVFIPAFVVNVAIQFGMFGMLHEACHQTAFESRNLNLLAGWVAALGQPMTPALMRAFHFEHHRHTHELDRDPELAGLKMMQSWPRHVVWLVTLTGIPVLFARWMWTTFAALTPASVDGLWSKVLPFVKPEKRSRIGWEARGLVLLHGAIIAATVLWLPNLVWLYVGQAAAHAVLSFYITCEHRGLPEEGTILERTRSLKTPGFVRWLLWNMPYHAEHHAWPAVPFHNLGQVHAEMSQHLVHRVSPLYLHMHRGSEPGTEGQA